MGWLRMDGISLSGSNQQDHEAQLTDFEPSSAREYVTIKLDRRQREAVEYAARKSGKTVKEFVHEAAIRTASRIISQ